MIRRGKSGIANFDSTLGTPRALGRALRGQDFPALGIVPDAVARLVHPLVTRELIDVELDRFIAERGHEDEVTWDAPRDADPPARRRMPSGHPPWSRPRVVR